ncbi:ATP-grasp domain-containing protein [Myroides profundi]|uniref:RimK-like ATP-grasp domain-containing protein n=1 Tax=Myroides profundi TaxID=480520 RepID=A0AAJ4W712_MYRPR|nr:hypothetical protein [Myroides profundi]AJH15306.1 hypothetical protein MPR_2135 [Myroides profundi]SER65377.1 RimK-like ATP-grasp domain-containing protein [Myroides profundi]
MKIGIHNSDTAYSKRWIVYCQINKINYIVVNAYADTIIHDLKGCEVFLWHHHHSDYRDVNFAKQLLFSLEQAGVKVFPDFKTGWHFDDKLGQKYLFEANNIPAAKAWAFYEKTSALKWVDNISYPKIFKLRGGAGSSNVKMIRDKGEAKRFINKAFGKGFSGFDYWSVCKDKFKLFFKKRASLNEVLKMFILSLFPRLGKAHLLPRQKGYVYFQEFIPNDGYDIRIQITGDKALAMVRYTREGDFRASGSNNLTHETELLSSEVIKFAFDIADRLQLQSCALDLVRDNRDNQLYVIENSYCYGVDQDEFDYGYWTRDGVYHKDKKFNGLDWIIQDLLEK